MPSPGVLTTADVGNEWSTPRKWIEQGLRAGDRFGHFVVQDKLGSGGMATVFRAHDERLDREVALKLVSPEDGMPHGHHNLELPPMFYDFVSTARHLLLAVDKGGIFAQSEHVMHDDLKTLLPQELTQAA